MNSIAKRIGQVKQHGGVGKFLVLLGGLALVGWLTLGYLAHLASLFEALPWFPV